MSHKILVFSDDPKNYVRDFDPYKHAKRHLKEYIKRKVKDKGFTEEQVDAWVDKEWKEGGKLGVKPIPTKIVYYDEEKGGDREFRVTTWENYLEEIRREEHVVSPSGTAFFNQNRKLSPLNNYLSDLKKKRSVFKKKEFECEMNEDGEGQVVNGTLQKSMKTSTNSLSGAESLPNNPTYAESIHPVLTSYCRTGTSHANSINERFIIGNRHYWHPLVVKNDIISLVSNYDEARIRSVIEEFNLTIPTHEDVVGIVKRCTDPYFRDDEEFENIKELIYTLNDTDRVFYAYHCDLFTLEKFNRDLVKNLIMDLITVKDIGMGIEEADQYISGLGELEDIAVGIICPDQTKGVKRNDWNKDPKRYSVLGSAAKNFISIMNKHKNLIDALWTTDLLPSSIYELPSIRRKCVLGGDTDSTLFTVQYWKRVSKETKHFSDTTRSISNVIIYLSGALVAHVLRQMSRNSGAIDEHISTLTMKNEFFFPSFVLTGRAKHYYANQEVKEGNFLKKASLEIKGVHMRNSRWPSFVKKDVAEMATYALESGSKNRDISLTSMFNEISIYENMIVKGMEKGDSSFLTGFKITDGSANDIFVDFWETVFANKYGHAEGRTLRTLKVPVTLEKPEDTERWIESISDGSVKEGAKQFIKKFGKDKFTFMAVPDTIIASTGVPKEMLPILDRNRIFNETLSGFYLILESLNIFIEKEYGDFVSDFFEYDLYNNRILDPERSLAILGD